MRHVYFWLDRAADSHSRHLSQVAQQSIQDVQRAAEVQLLLGAQTWVHDVASTMLDLASLSGNVLALQENPKLLQAKSYAEMAEVLDGLYEGLKDFESARASLRSALEGRDVPKPLAELTPDTWFMSGEQLNDFKSSVSDLKSFADAVFQQGGDWRKALKGGPGAAAIGQIVGRFAKAYLETNMAERQRHIETLLGNVTAADKVQGAVFDEMQRIRARRDQAEDAYNALNKLVVIGSGGTPMTSCLLKLDGICGNLNLNYTSSFAIPPEAQVGNVLVLTPEEEEKPWGLALLALNAGLPRVEQWLERTPDIKPAVRPSLTLLESVFDPGEQLTARFTAPVCLASASWVGIVPTQTPHGSAETNLTNVRSDRVLLRNAEAGQLAFEVPSGAGRYDLRMNDWDTGVEIASVSFEVAEETTDVPSTSRVQIEETAARPQVGSQVAPPGGTDIDWSTRPDWGSREIGKRHTYRCPQYSPTVHQAYGTDTYSGDSAICYAAVHAGVIGTAGGTVTIEIHRGAATYTGSERNGVTSQSAVGSPAADFVISFVFVR
jgi:hypothetical protein